MQTEMTMRYLDEIQRLKRIIDENGFAADSDEEEEADSSPQAKKPRLRRKQSHMSEDMEEYQPLRLKSGESKGRV